jgi:hypothetical protein
MHGAKQTLAFALERYPERVEAVPIRELALESARQNDRRPAYVKLAVPDELVKAIRGTAEGGDLVLLVHVPKDVVERQGSRIILPGEAGTR